MRFSGLGVGQSTVMRVPAVVPVTSAYGRSDADVIEDGRPEFEIEVTFVGFAVGGDRIRFVDGEDV